MLNKIFFLRSFLDANFDTIDKSSNVLVANCDHVPHGKTFKNLFSISKVESRVQGSLLLLMLDQFMIRCTENFSLLANNRKLEPLPKNSSGLLRKKSTSLLFEFSGKTTETNFSMQHSTPDPHRCSSLAQNSFFTKFHCVEKIRISVRTRNK